MITLNLRSVVLGLVLLLAVALVAYGSYAYGEGLAPFAPRDDQWHGVFLTNGQVYFGHLYSGPGEYVRLRDVYYVLATQLQPQDPQQRSQLQLSLQRKGTEIHNPTNEMRIAKAQILFIEELRPDSAIIQAIFQLKNAPPATPGPATTPAPATPAPASPTAARTASPSPSPR